MDSEATREDYLAQSDPHPLLEGEVLTPAQWIEIGGSLPGEVWVMGRWGGEGSALLLDDVAFTPPEGEPTGFLQKWWRRGDWLGVKIGFVEGAPAWLETRLLAACEGEPFFPRSRVQTGRFAEFLAVVRSFFRQHNFEEVLSPSLVLCPGTEVYVDPFSVAAPKGESYYLPTSPEIHLKKALSQGRSKVFEVAKVFRSGEITSHHREEFWMLEWYRVQSPLTRLQKDVEELIAFLGGPAKEAECWSVSELFREHLKVELTPNTTPQELRAWCDQRKIPHSRDDSYSDLFHRLFLEFVEPHLMGEELAAVHDYPPQLAAYSRINPEGWADRLEIYWRGLELANGFFEVCSAQEQMVRMAKDNDEKKKRGAAPVGMDPDFYLHLRQGFPATSGMALGLDRLFMALHKIQSIDELRSF